MRKPNTVDFSVSKFGQLVVKKENPIEGNAKRFGTILHLCGIDNNYPASYW